MKDIFIIFFTIFTTFQVNCQTSSKYALYYGGHYFNPSNGFAHSIGLQRDLTNTKIGSLEGEFSVFFGGPYSFDFQANNKGIESKVGPYKALHIIVGSNFKFPITTKENVQFSIGLCSGYGRYEIPVSVQNPKGNGASVQGYFEPRNNLLLGFTLRYIQKLEIGNLNFLIIPNFQLYKTSIYTNSLGVLIAFKM